MQGSSQFTWHRGRKSGDYHRRCQGPVGTCGVGQGGFLQKVMLKLGLEDEQDLREEHRGHSRAVAPRDGDRGKMRVIEP